MFEGEKPFACENEMLGMFQLPNIRQGPAGSANIMVTLHVGEDGILHATAYDEDTGEQGFCFFSHLKQCGRLGCRALLVEVQTRGWRAKHVHSAGGVHAQECGKVITIGTHKSVNVTAATGL